MVLVLAFIANYFVAYFFIFVVAGTCILFGLVPDVSEATMTTAVEVISAVLLLTLCAFGITPIGEKIFRFCEGARLPTGKESEALEPIFQKVVKKCGFQRDQFDLFVLDEDSINAFALGRRTVAITKGAFRLPDTLQEGLFAHELGHHHHNDSVRGIVLFMLMSTGGLMLAIASKISLITIALGGVSLGAGNKKENDGCVFGLPLLIAGAILGLYTWILNFFIVAPVHLGSLFSSRRQEYRADKFAHDNGYGQGMIDLLYVLLQQDSSRKGLMAALKRTHPVTSDRIRKLEILSSSAIAITGVSEA